ncbi:hypothetical protein [Streptomyces sp. NPDC051079]|uniref:hypothetical protein n=1 Tax=Streptomyces sp. NPDC051079 TaxID=3155043 RepID=UPI003450A7D2
MEPLRTVADACEMTGGVETFPFTESLRRDCYTTYMNVVHMTEHPRALTRPGLLLRTARVLLDGRARA